MDSTQAGAKRTFAKNLRGGYAASLTFCSPDTAETTYLFQLDKTDRSTSTALHPMAQLSLARDAWGNEADG